MIFYLATYPRSGNSLLQQIVQGNFGYLPTQLRRQATPEQIDPVEPHFAKKYSMQAASQPLPGWPEGLLWAEFMATYRLKPELPARRHLLPLDRYRLTESVRQTLAIEDTCYFIKTHEWPFPRYFDGERVVQVVRHPGPTIWSYFRYSCERAAASADRIFDNPPVTVERVSSGDVEFGSWSTYQAEWKAAASKFADRFLLLRYEEILDDFPLALRLLADFTGLPCDNSRSLDFASYSARLPGYGSRGLNDGYESFFGRAQLELLWETHRAVAEEFGYRPPDLSLATGSDQIDRLSRYAELAWARGQEISLTSAAFKSRLLKTNRRRQRLLREIGELRDRLEVAERRPDPKPSFPQRLMRATRRLAHSLTRGRHVPGQ